MSYPFEIGKVYSFDTLSPLFIGRTIARAKLKSIVDATIARQFSAIDQQHAMIYPTLPPGSPVSVSASIFYVFEAQNKSTIVLAENWIDLTTVEVIEHIDIDIRVARASLGDVERIRALLSSGGIKDFTINIT